MTKKERQAIADAIYITRRGISQRTENAMVRVAADVALDLATQELIASLNIHGDTRRAFIAACATGIER